MVWTRGRLLARYGNVYYEYDGDGFRREKATVNNTVKYYYQNGKLLAEKHADSSKDLYFIYHGDEIVGFLMGEEGVYYHQKDVLGNVIAVYDAVGGLVASYSYNAWGICYRY